MQLNYKPASDGRLKDESAIYHVDSNYQVEELSKLFLSLKANVCDLNPALVYHRNGAGFFNDHEPSK